MKTKTCAGCGVELTEDNCYKKANGYFRAYCKVCHNNRSGDYNKISSKSPHRLAKANERMRVERQDPTNLAKVILSRLKRIRSKT